MTPTSQSERGCVVLDQPQRIGNSRMLRLGLRPQPHSVVCAFAALAFALTQGLFATESRLADAAEKLDRATVRTLLKQHADVNAPQTFAPTGLQQTSPGQRPGFVVSQFHSSPERAEQCSTISSALSGLPNWCAVVTKGVAPGWHVIASLGRCQSRT
jgi:hypothetical protein